MTRYEVSVSTYSGRMFSRKGLALKYAGYLLKEDKVNEIMIRKF